MSKITPCLWFDGQAEEAAELYVSLFPNSHLDSVNRAPADNPSGPEGSVLLVGFTLDGQRYTALNGGPQFPFTEAISLEIECADQAEVDRYWTALTADGGEPGQCGWCKDRFGLSWQVVPRQLGEYLGGPDPDAARRAAQAMLAMGKIEIDGLRVAYEGRRG